MFGKNGQMALVGKQVKTPSPKKSFSYRTKARSSHVDETLFGAPSRFLQQVETKRQSNDADWDPPWSTGPTKKGTPLLWTPFDYNNGSGDTADSPHKNSPALRPRSSSTGRLKKIRQTSKTFNETATNQHRSRNRKYNPDVLVNSRLNSSGDAQPGNFYNSNAQHSFKRDRSPAEVSQGNFLKEQAGDISDPKMRLDLDAVAKEATNSAGINTDEEKSIPVIKPRLGSNIGSLKTKVVHSDNASVYDNNEIEDKTIARALQLANQSKQIHNSLLPTTTPLTTPRTNRSSRATSPRIVRIARLSDFTLPLSARKNDASGLEENNGDLILSATGTSVPLSARSNASSRPSSARSRSSRRNSASGLRPSWKP